MLLEVRNIHSGYGKMIILKGINIQASENEIVSIIGANGSGKTTLLRTISGFVPMAEGSVVFRGEELKGLKPNEIVTRGVAQVPEGRQLFPKMTVHENIELGAYLRKDAQEIRRDIREWIYGLFPVLKERENQLAGTLSGGEQQMLAISRGLMSKPKLLMLDEPSFGLAPLVIEKVFETIRKVCQGGLAIILVEQNSTVTLEISDRTYVLETGRIVLEGESRNLIDNPHIKEAYLGI